MLCFVESIVFQCLLVFGFFCMMFSSLVFGVRGSIPQFRTIDVPETVSCPLESIVFRCFCLVFGLSWNHSSSQPNGTISHLFVFPSISFHSCCGEQACP